MGWGIGYDENWKRDIGYGVPATCDHPGCGNRINRGLAYVCADQQPHGGDGCGLYFCDEHLRFYEQWMMCERCGEGKPPFEPAPDTPEWVQWKLTDESWQQWRDEHPDEVAAMKAANLVYTAITAA